MMDSVSLMWACILVLPVILTMALCIGCRKRAQTRISQSVGDYDNKSSYTSHQQPSFTVIRNHSTGNPSNFNPSLQLTSHDAFLSVPRSPLAQESPRSSFTPEEADNESVPSYENENQKQAEDEEYINDTYISGYIDVLPDIVQTPVSGPEPETEPEPEVEMQRSDRLSSSNTEEYQNVLEEQRDSIGDSLEYVNVPEQHQVGQRCDNLSYGGGSNQDSEEDMDYENVIKKSQD